MVIAIAILLALVCAAIVVFPFLRHRHWRQAVDPFSAVEELTRDRLGIYRELAKLKEGYRLGNVPEPEYQAVSQNLRRRAAENLWLQRRWEEQLKSLEQAIEERVQAYRKAVEEAGKESACPECDASAPGDQGHCPDLQLSSASCGLSRSCPKGGVQTSS